MPQRATKHITVEQRIVDTTPEGSIRRSAAFAGIPFEHNVDRLGPSTVPSPGLFGPSVQMVENPPTARVRYSLEDLAAIRARHRERNRLRDQQREERYDMYGEDHRSRDHLLMARQNRSYPPMFRNENPDSDFWREDPQARERRATEEEVQEDNRIGRLRAQARQRNEAFDEQVARNVRRRTTSEGVVLAHARQANLFG